MFCPIKNRLDTSLKLPVYNGILSGRRIRISGASLINEGGKKEREREGGKKDGKEEGNLQWFPLTEWAGRSTEAAPHPPPDPQLQAPPVLTNEVTEANMPGRLLSILLRKSRDY